MHRDIKSKSTLIIFLVASGWLWSQPSQADPQPKGDDNTKPRLVKYVNDKYKFSIQYPNTLKAASDTDSQSAYGSHLTTIAEFAMPDSGKGMPGGDIYGALQIRVGTSPAAVASCLSKPLADMSDQLTTVSDIRTTAINGARFLAFDLRAVAGGHRWSERSFSTLHNGVCYNVRVIETGEGFTVGPNVDQSEAADEERHYHLPFSAYDVFAQLVPVIQTFRFLAP